MYALCHVSLKLAHWFWRGGFFKFCQCIYASFLLSPLGKGYGHSFEHSPHLRVPHAKCLIEIGPVVLEEMIFKVLQCIFPISLLSPLGKTVALHLNKLESTLPKNALCQVWLKLVHWRRRWKYKMFMTTRTTTMTTTTDKFWSKELTWALGSGELTMQWWPNYIILWLTIRIALFLWLLSIFMEPGWT